MEEIITSKAVSADGSETVEIIEVVEKPTSDARRLVVSFDPKKAVLILVVLAAAAALYFGKGLVVAAVVYGKPIGRVEVIKLLERQSGKAALTSLVNNRLIDHEAMAKGVSVSDNEIQEEIKKVETSLSAQGLSLEAALAGENMTRQDLENQVMTRKKVEKILADKLTVSDGEVDAYIKDNGIKLEKGQEAEQKGAIKEQVVNQKLSSEAPQLLERLNAEAGIKYFVNY